MRTFSRVHATRRHIMPSVRCVLKVQDYRVVFITGYWSIMEIMNESMVKRREGAMMNRISAEGRESKIILQ